MNNSIFITILKEALDRVPGYYFGKEYWTDQMLDTWGVRQETAEREALEKYLSRYGERVFCYELYHQIRILMEAYYAKNPPRSGSSIICLQAELKKEQIGNVVEHFPEIQSLEKEYIPDFLLHSPGNFDHQKLILEVKSDPRVSFSDIKDDLSKIQEFITRYRYRRGILLIINSPSERIKLIIAKRENQQWIQENLPDRRRILFMQRKTR